VTSSQPQQISVLSARIPHVCLPPAIPTNFPGGVGFSIWLGEEYQHSTSPFRRIPHEREYPTATSEKVPFGAALASLDSPQHSTFPSVFTPHECQRPVLTCSQPVVDDALAWQLRVRNGKYSSIAGGFSPWEIL